MMTAPSSDLSYFFNNPTYSDVKLYTKSRTILANSIVLACNSSVFKKKVEDENEKDIFLDYFLDEEDEMEMIIASLYNRSNLVVSVEILNTVAKFGATYQIQWIVAEALRFVKGNISHENCIDVCRTGYKLKENFNYPDIFEVSLEFIKNSKYLEEIVTYLELIEDVDFFSSLPILLFKNLLENEHRRDEKRVIQIVQRWFTRDSNVIQALEILPLLQLSQLYLVNQQKHSSFFEFLISSEKLTSEDRKTILQLSTESIADSRNCIVTGVGFSKEVPKQMQKSVQHVKVFLESPTWKNCSFDDLIMVKQFGGVNEYIFLELILVWCTANQITENQVKNILGLIKMSDINPEYLQDLLDHLQQSVPHLPDQFGGDLVTRSNTHDFNSNQTRQFTSVTLTSDQVRNMKLKKHSLTERPCGVRGCWDRSLGVVELRIRRDNFPFYKTCGGSTARAPLEHSHNEDLWHVYFRVGHQIVSCFCNSWSNVEEKITSVAEGVVVKVVCRGR